MAHYEFDQSAFSGWNTFNGRSVLSHVLMPTGFAVTLGLKSYATGRVLREALIGRFGDDEEKIHPYPRSYDGGYTRLSVRFGHGEITVESTVCEGELILLVTPTRMEPRPMALLVKASILWNREGSVRHGGDRLLGLLPGRTVTVFTDGEPLREMNTGLDTPYLSLALGRPVAVSTGSRRSGEEARRILDAARERMERETRKYGALSEVYNAMRACVAWDTIYEPEKERVCTPVSRLWNINWGGYVLFCWDTYFSAMLAMCDNRALACANVLAITNEKTEEGFVPNFGAANDDKSRDRSQPPVGSLAVREIYRIYRDKAFVAALFDDLLVWNRWFKDRRMLKNGQLCWGSDPYAPRAGRRWETHSVGDTAGAALESGLDNSPMYDDIPFDGERNLMMLADVGLTGLYVMDCEALADLADLLGRPEGAELRQRAEHVKDGLDLLWDEEAGIFCNQRTDTKEFSRRYSPTNFYALFSDRVSDAQARRMMDEHFYNPEEFWGDYILPTIARNDPAYPDQDYWRGRIWAPTNFLAYLAMRRKGLFRECRDLAAKSKDLLLREWLELGHVHENYNADTGEGCDVRNSDKFYHWGALLALIALMDGGAVAGPEQPL